MFRNFKVRLGVFLFLFIASKSDYFVELFLKSATNIISLVHDEDSLDKDTHDENTCFEDTLDEDTYDLDLDRYSTKFLGFVENKDIGKRDEASYKDRYSPGFQGSESEDEDV